MNYVIVVCFSGLEGIKDEIVNNYSKEFKELQCFGNIDI